MVDDLELKVTPGQIKEACLDKGFKEAFRQSVTDPVTGRYTGHDPFSRPLTAITLAMVSDKLTFYLKRILGDGFYARVQDNIATAPNTVSGLVEVLIGAEAEPSKLDSVVRKHHEELTAFAEAYNMLVKAKFKPEVDETTLGQQAASNGKGVKFREYAISGLKQLVEAANLLYDRSTSQGFLSHVSGGVIEEGYRQGLTGSPQTL